jgi:hypothetical protein
MARILNTYLDCSKKCQNKNLANGEYDAGCLYQKNKGS